MFTPYHMLACFALLCKHLGGGGGPKPGTACLRTAIGKHSDVAGTVPAALSS